MKRGMADYISEDAKIKALLSNGEEEEIYTDLIQRNVKFQQWHEDMHPDGIGYYQWFEEEDLDDEKAELIDINHWYFVNENKNIDVDKYNNVSIDKIIEIIYADWKMDEATIDFD